MGHKYNKIDVEDLEKLQNTARGLSKVGDSLVEVSEAARALQKTMVYAFGTERDKARLTINRAGSKEDLTPVLTHDQVEIREIGIRALKKFNNDKNSQSD